MVYYILLQHTTSIVVGINKNWIHLLNIYTSELEDFSRSHLAPDISSTVSLSLPIYFKIRYRRTCLYHDTTCSPIPFSHVSVVGSRIIPGRHSYTRPDSINLTIHECLWATYIDPTKLKLNIYISNSSLLSWRLKIPVATPILIPASMRGRVTKKVEV